MFQEFVRLCSHLDSFRKGLLAIGGTRIKARDNKDRNFTRSALQDSICKADGRLAEYLHWLDTSDPDEESAGGASIDKRADKIVALGGKRDLLRSLLTDLEASGQSQVSLTDPNSRAMAGDTKVGVGYNVQFAVDAKHKLIVERAVTNQVVDMGLLTQTAGPARDMLRVERIDVAAD